MNLSFRASLVLSSFLLIAVSGYAASPTADEELKVLQEGNARFLSEKEQHGEESLARRKELIGSQHPPAIIFSCSDSRVPPELIFDQGLGELFVVREAGNTLESGAIASIEYAASHLGSHLLVVMGHESCGAVKATIDTPEGKSAGSQDLDALVGLIRPALKDVPKASLADPLLRAPVIANVDYVAEHLTSRSPVIAKLVKSGDLKIVRAIYDLKDGRVEFLPASKH